MSDVMHQFELYQPGTVEDALALLDEHGKDAWVMAGGKDSLDWFKDRVKTPPVVVDISGIEALNGIREEDGGGRLDRRAYDTDRSRRKRSCP